MSYRLFSGSLLGMAPGARHRMEVNPFVRVFLDEPMDEERLSEALQKALLDCPYMNLSIKEDEGIFLKAEENPTPLSLLKEEPGEINGAANNGHSAGVSVRGNRITVMLSHALTDGCGLFWFVRTLLDRYFGETGGIFRGASEEDYAADLLENNLPVSPDFQPYSLPEGPYFTVEDPKDPDFSNTFLLTTSYASFKELCKKIGGSTQNVMTALSLKALTEAYPENRAKMTARLPINARTMFSVPHTFQNASLANMRVTLTPEEAGDPEFTAKAVAEQCAAQNSKDAVAYQCNRWREVLMAETREERMQRILPLLGKDAILISNLGRGLFSDTYASHITAVLPGAMMFPLMVYGIPWGEKMGFSGYDGGNGNYKKALKAVLEREGLLLEERDPATGKAV